MSCCKPKKKWIRPDKLSGAEISAICQEAGMQAVRKNRYVILTKDLEKGYKANVKKNENEFEFYKWLLVKLIDFQHLC